MGYPLSVEWTIHCLWIRQILFEVQMFYEIVVLSAFFIVLVIIITGATTNSVTKGLVFDVKDLKIY